MTGLSFEAKLVIGIIAVVLVGVVWLAAGRRQEAPPTQVAPVTTQSGPAREREARLRTEEGTDTRRRVRARLRSRDLPTPAVAGQPQIGTGGPPPRENLDAVSADADLDFETLKTMALTDADPDNRVVALWLLGSEEDQPVMPILMQALSDSDPEVRMAALESISEFDDPPIEALAIALDDPDPEIRFEALSVAAEIENQAVIPLLEKGLNDPDEDVRSLAEGLADFDEPFVNPAPGANAGTP